MLDGKVCVSLDYDDTLSIWVSEEHKYCIHELMYKKLMKHIDEGHVCVIVTARTASHRNLDEIEEFINEYHLPIEEVYFTHHHLKGPFLKGIGCDIHYDDYEEHLNSAIENGIKAYLVTQTSVGEYK